MTVVPIDNDTVVLENNITVGHTYNAPAVWTTLMGPGDSIY